MKNRRILKKQQGFFDLGLGLALTLIFGGTAATIEANHKETSLAKQETEIVKHVDVQQQIAVVEQTVEE